MRDVPPPQGAVSGTASLQDFLGACSGWSQSVGTLCREGKGAARPWSDPSGTGISDLLPREAHLPCSSADPQSAGCPASLWLG